MAFSLVLIRVAILAAIRTLRSVRTPFAGGEYALALFLFPVYACCPRLAASEVYQHWSALASPESDMRAIHTLQIVYAPLRWPMAVHLVRSIFGADMHHYEHRIRGVRIVVITQDPLDGAGSGGGLGGGGDGGGLGGGGDGGGLGGGDGDAPSVPERPTILFVPGGAFIADFEAVDLFFLYKWVREAQATLVYVTYMHLTYLTISTNRSPKPSLTFHCPLVYRYEFAPQAPYPTGMMQVAAVYRALRDGSHDAALGFRATPLVVAGLSAGGNLAVSAILSILHPALLTRSPHGGGTAGAADTSAAAANGRPLLNAMGSSYARSCYNPRLAAPATAVAITRDWPLPPPQWPNLTTGRLCHR